jgi:hypothetical protein
LDYGINGVGLERADPNRQRPFLKGVSEKNHGLHGGGIDNKLVNLYLEEFLLLPRNRRDLFGQGLSG